MRALIHILECHSYVFKQALTIHLRGPILHSSESLPYTFQQVQPTENLGLPSHFIKSSLLHQFFLPISLTEFSLFSLSGPPETTLSFLYLSQYTFFIQLTDPSQLISEGPPKKIIETTDTHQRSLLWTL